MPTTPPVVYVPPSAPPAAAGAIHEPAPAGAAALVISGVTTADINGVVFYCGLINGKPAWSTNGTQTAAPTNTIVLNTGSGTWVVSRGSSYSATKLSPGAPSPVGLTAWTVGTGTGSPVLAAYTPATPPAITA